MPDYITSPLIADTSTTAREDYLGLITMVEPVSFPLMRLLPHRGCNNILHSWLMDNIPYENAIVASQEGYQIPGLRTGGTTTPLAASLDAWPAVNEASYRRQRASNGTHIVTKGVSVSGTQQSSDEAGVGDEYNHQVYRIGTALLMQQEHNLHWSVYTDGDSGNSYARQMHGLIPWILSTGLDNSAVTIAAHSVANTYSSTVAYNPTWYPLEEDTGSASGDVVPRASLTGTGPFRAYWNGSSMASYSAGQVIPRLYFSGGASNINALDGMYFADATADTADAFINLQSSATYTDGADTTGDFSVDLTNELLHTYILQPAYAKGMKIGGSIMLCSSAIKRLMSNFAHVYGTGSSPTASVSTLLNTRTIAASDKKFVASIDYFETQFGVIAVHQDRYFESSTPYSPLGTNQGFYSTTWSNSKRYYVTPSKSFILIEPDMAEVAPFKDRGFFHADLGKRGDSIEGMLTSEMSLRVLNPKAFAGGFGFAATEGTLTT